MDLKHLLFALFLPCSVMAQGLVEPDVQYLHSIDAYGDLRVRANDPDSGEVLQSIDTLGTTRWVSPLRLDSMRIRPSDTVLVLYWSAAGVADSLYADFGPFIGGGGGDSGSGGSPSTGAGGIAGYIAESFNTFAIYGTRDLGVLNKSMRVRSATDTADIGFDRFGNLDTARIRALGERVWVLTLYDQSANGRDLVQSNSSKQPLVYDTGFFFIGEARRVAVKFEATDFIGYEFASPVSQPNDLYGSWKYDSLPNIGRQAYWQDGNTNTNRQVLAFVNSDGTWRFFAGGGTFTDGPADTLSHSWYTSYTNVGNDSVFRDNGLRLANSALGNASLGGVSLGGNYLEASTSLANGRFSELIVFGSKQKDAIRGRLNDYLTDTAYTSPRDTTTAWLITLTGQSNADGRVDAADLPSALSDTIDADTYIWNGTSWVTLRLATAAGQDWGPELAMARALSDSMPYRRYYIVKQATGGTELAQTAFEDWSPNSTGEQFADLQAQYEAAIAAIPVPYEYRANVWIQGEADATTTAWANDYATNLRHLIDTWADTTGLTVDWVIGRINTNLPTGTYPNTSTVRAAQSLVASERANVYLIDADSFGLLPDNTHYNADGNVSYGLAIQQLLQR